MTNPRAHAQSNVSPIRKIREKLKRFFGPWGMFVKGFIKHPVMVGSIVPRGETLRGIQWPVEVAWLFGTRVAETILASGPKRPHQQAGHMDCKRSDHTLKALVARGPSTYGFRPSAGPGMTGKMRS